ncbi:MULTISPECIES: KpsF/GutQ family sugar-phosphate isomerase [Pseudomonas]|jgi:arabinose-5-phosphate isomerase|uniref:Arabinose 5-phosphate isomerase n=2 Tax=Pseudomonas abyssi TaxID=170540 RepID=A0A2A3MMP7_9PSED|nr:MULTISPECIES: KpsF/GutQ family sugar-phosphate isomerase [Pseudomonadaceae]MAD00496.1 KpsF/GutQ family sugar-phosphate isomerase [Pseudomonadales bacterium]MAG65131.1 KpsF/GutQ family sugar-phosphate isomerase [Pseudomonadales bacterium]PBK06086.1 D-arabinose 5-phosphate isomerase [Pseudomonas abyssi]RGP54613.1 D-arabinose 5-phosphate isomerase [Halopseudomonas gallaeciensis]|tara:strand:+ start:21019 stop:21990 length:972 start_codon:yes stop_codon:yes gene_type:complete
MADFDYIASARRTISMERDAVDSLLQRLGAPFSTACDTLLACRGRVVVTGMGKSGHVGRKLAATLASTGTPAFFVHPGEASHGDMGMITAEDVVIALSNSGNTAEVVTLLPLIKRLGAPLISLTGNAESTLALAAVANLDTGVEQEACPLNLAPTSSTTTALVMGDALAIALLEARGFSAEDFAFSHPGGSLGRRLLLLVDDIMHSGDSMPLVRPDVPLRDALLEMTRKGLGLTGIEDEQGELVGIFTDGDLRRTLDQNIDFQRVSIGELMTRGSKTARAGMLAAEALKIMEDARINGLFVIDSNGRPVGALNMHDLLRAGVV